jgi:hypothetical protein
VEDRKTLGSEGKRIDIGPPKESTFFCCQCNPISISAGWHFIAGLNTHNILYNFKRICHTLLFGVSLIIPFIRVHMNFRLLFFSHRLGVIDFLNI